MIGLIKLEEIDKIYLNISETPTTQKRSMVTS